MTEFQNRFKQIREKYNVQWELLEQDYLLAWMLAGIAATPLLKELLVFKGGTALKKSFFGEYRFSQDLDFTSIGTLPEDEHLDLLLGEACERAAQMQAIHGYPIRIESSRYMEKSPHPFGQKAYTILGQLPWHRELYVRVMVEITTQEPLLLPPEERKIIHNDYGEVLDASLKTYKLEEIIAEKVRAILQFAAKLHERGWGRSRARDYYDLWRILKEHRNHIDLSILPAMVSKKCALKNVNFSGPSDLFTPALMSNLDDAWSRWLAPFVPGLPAQHRVISELKAELEEIMYHGDGSHM